MSSSTEWILGPWEVPPAADKRPAQKSYNARFQKKWEAMYVHPGFDPVALQLGPLAVRWYGLMYLLGFGLFFLLGRYRLKARSIPANEIPR